MVSDDDALRLELRDALRAEHRLDRQLDLGPPVVVPPRPNHQSLRGVVCLALVLVRQVDRARGNRVELVHPRRVLALPAQRAGLADDEGRREGWDVAPGLTPPGLGRANDADNLRLRGRAA